VQAACEESLILSLGVAQAKFSGGGLLLRTDGLPLATGRKELLMLPPPTHCHSAQGPVEHALAQCELKGKTTGRRLLMNRGWGPGPNYIMDSILAQTTFAAHAQPLAVQGQRASAGKDPQRNQETYSASRRFPSVTRQRPDDAAPFPRRQRKHNSNQNLIPEQT
jgi:hypothetical protein